MAISTGFFDAVLDESTGIYDRAYDSQDFTTYFEQIIGSGVCVYGNDNSMLVALDTAGEQAIISSGYLFIHGYWLKNDALYTVSLSGLAAGVHAICAKLNLSHRRIVLETQPKTVLETDTNMLVLAYVTIPPSGAATLEDTRSNEAICGLIDSAGSLSAKVAYALNYIDTEIEERLNRIESDMQAQEAAIDHKIGEAAALISKIAPPPIGSVKYSAAAAIEPEWLPCNGAFINETDYPELVAALGKHTPGVQDFSELLASSAVEQASNCVVYNNTAWIYLLKQKKLVGISSAGAKREITVAGVDSLLELPRVDTVLSISGGSLYLAQNNQAASYFVLLEAVSFTGTESALTMNTLNVSAKMAGLDASYCVPKVSAIAGIKYMTLGVSEKAGPVAETTDAYLSVIKWTAGSFAQATVIEHDYIRLAPNTVQFNYVKASGYAALRTLLAFNSKTAGDLFMAAGYITSVSFGGTNSLKIGFDPRSYTRHIYGQPTAISNYLGDGFTIMDAPGGVKGKYWVRFITNTVPPELSVLPVAANNEYLYRAAIVDKRLQIEFGTYNPKTVFDWKSVGPQLPSRARLFKESIVFAETQSLWFIFVGTGILFSDSAANGEWGYLDTQEKMGAITQFGTIDYDLTNNILWISGTDTIGVPKLARIKLPNLYNYANNGAWLPMLAADGVPAYIKAKEPA